MKWSAPRCWRRADTAGYVDASITINTQHVEMMAGAINGKVMVNSVRTGRCLAISPPPPGSYPFSQREACEQVEHRGVIHAEPNM